ncbi:MAG: anti-sigma factor antagonist [Acidimicrobiales bacterium]
MRYDWNAFDSEGPPERPLVAWRDLEAHITDGFSVTVDLSEDNAGTDALLCLMGEIDLVNVAVFDRALHSVIDQGNRRLVVDLGHLDFMGIAGLRVLGAAAARLDPLGGTLMLRSASALTRRVLSITGLSEAIAIEGVESGFDHLGPEQPATEVAATATTDVDLLGDVVPVAALAASDDVVDAALRLVVALARATVEGADGVSVSLARQGRLMTVAATDETIAGMDIDQYATGEGPCIDAATEGRWFHIESLEEELRWPSFIPRARSRGINSVLSSPLLARDQPVGALNIYSFTERAFAAQEQQLAGVFATQTSLILAAAGVDASAGLIGRRLQGALRARETIALALGVLMERDGVTADEAFNIIRRSSQSSDRPLSELARDVVSSTRQVGAAPAPGDRGE